MLTLIQRYPALFPLFFVSLWLITVSFLGWLSGWYRLMAQYPDQTDEVLAEFRRRSGVLGPGVNYNGIVYLSVCRSGLRIGTMRIFGPFSRNFFVPWEEITITRTAVFFWPRARLRFGFPPIGSLRISATLANSLARAAAGKWPEPGPFPQEAIGKAAGRYLAEWAMISGVAAVFFTLAPLVAGPARNRPPILVGILFPAVVFGVATIIRFLGRNR